MEEPAFWQDADAAQEVIQEKKQLQQWVLPLQRIRSSLKDIDFLLPEAYLAKEEDLIQEMLQQLQAIEEEVAALEIKRMLSGELDDANCFISINAGAGGTESCDWVQMLARMYQRWATQHDWNVEVISVLEGEVAGLKNITMKFNGSYAYGYTRAERGVHRLVRISPFDSGGRRHQASLLSM